MPANPLAKSAKIPPGPVTKESVPSTGMVARRSSTSGTSSSPTSGLSGRKTCAASPSSDGMGGEGSPASAPARSASRAASTPLSVIVSSVCWSIGPSASQSRTAGMACVSRKPACSSVTRVDSALSGRKAALSFSCRPVSLPLRAPSGAAPPSQTSRTRSGSSQRSRDMGFFRQGSRSRDSMGSPRSPALDSSTCALVASG
jgi:hypothetical protein